MFFLRAACLVVFGAAIPEGNAPRSIMAELEAVWPWRAKAVKVNVQTNEADLRDTYEALPKNSNGRLGAPAIRYALHRLLERKHHGWRVKTLDSRGETWDSASPLLALGDRVPTRILEIFEKRLNSTGLDLNELAVLASTVENMVHSEGAMRLDKTIEALGFLGVRRLSQENVSTLIIGYMEPFLRGVETTDLTAETIKAMYLKPKLLSTDIAKWLDTVKAKVLADKTNLEKENVLELIQAITNGYGHYQETDCKAMHSALINLDKAGSGRIRLSDFYGKPTPTEVWSFSESVSWLQQFGALDESDRNQLRVMIPNYVLGPSNCLGPSSYFTICCSNACEDLMGYVESHLKGPLAAPAQIMSILMTQNPNRTFSAALRKLLQDVASHHEGLVPIHGRLFEQWMQEAYPRYCPFPHVSGTATPMTGEQFRNLTGRSGVATAEERQQWAGFDKDFAQKQKGFPRGSATRSTSRLWSMEEELVDPTSHAVQLRSVRGANGEDSGISSRVMMQYLMFFAASVSFGLASLNTLCSGVAVVRSKGDHVFKLELIAEVASFLKARMAREKIVVV